MAPKIGLNAAVQKVSPGPDLPSKASPPFSGFSFSTSLLLNVKIQQGPSSGRLPRAGQGRSLSNLHQNGRSSRPKTASDHLCGWSDLICPWWLAGKVRTRVLQHELQLSQRSTILISLRKMPMWHLQAKRSGWLTVLEVCSQIWVPAIRWTFSCPSEPKKRDGNPALQSHATNPPPFFSPLDQQLQ